KPAGEDPGGPAAVVALEVVAPVAAARPPGLGVGAVAHDPPVAEIPAGAAAGVDEGAVAVEGTEGQGGAEGDGEPAVLDLRQPGEGERVGVAVADHRDRDVEQRDEFGAQLALGPGGGARGGDLPTVGVDPAVEGDADAGGGVVDGADRRGQVL